MKKFLFLFLSLFLIGGLNSVKAEKLYSDFSEISAGGATWDAETHTMGWSASWSNAVQYFMIKGIENVGGYYDLSSWETITIKYSLTGTTNGVRIRMKDDTGGDGDWIIMEGDGEFTYKITDFKKGGSALNYKKIGGIQLSGGNQTSAASTATFTELYLERPDDPLALPKEKLTNAINIGGIQNSFAKTTASWNTLQTAISDGEAELVNPSATEESLNDATKAITDAISGFEYQDGYTKLTKAMANKNVDYVLSESTGLAYGTNTVDMNTYAELNEFDQFVVIASAGKPRFCMNRITANGQIGEDLASSNMIDINPNNSYTWATDKYQTIDEKKYTLELKTIASDWNGLARLNCIKGANYGNVTATDMLLYREITVGATGYATFGSLYKNAKPNGVKAYAAKVSGDKVVLTEVETVSAGKGVIIEAAAGSYAPTFDVAADETDSDLKVSNGTVEGDGSTIYVLGNGSQGVGFYLLKSGNKLEAGKAYLKIENAARGFIGINGMDVTGISTVKQAAGAKTGKIYNLNGQIVNKPTKGLFIVDGKVVSF